MPKRIQSIKKFLIFRPGSQVVFISWKQCKADEIADRFDNLKLPVAESKRIQGATPYYGANGIQDYVEGFTHEENIF